MKASNFFAPHRPAPGNDPDGILEWRGELACRMLSPKTKLIVQVFAEVTDYYTYVYVVSEEGEKLAVGMLTAGWVRSPELSDLRGDLVRVHCPLGRDGLTIREGGFGPLVYYGAAVVARWMGFRGIFSNPDDRSPDATNAWRRIYQRGFAHSEGEIDVMTYDEACNTGLVVWIASESADGDDV